MKTNLFFFFFIFFLLILILLWDTIKVNIVVFITLKRGIISQNCFWWKINDLLPDTTGSGVYQSLKQRGRFVQLNVLGKEFYLVTDLEDIRQLLDLSPNPFGPGKFKENFFKSFIPNNVGISTNPDWKYKREYNDRVLETDKYHHMNPFFFKYIRESFQKHKPADFEDFTELTRQLTSKILFGRYEYNPIIYKIFSQADSLLSARFGTNTVSQEDLKRYREYLHYELMNTTPNTLMYIGHKYHRMLPIESVIDQIPHWVFPIAGLFSVHLPRLLVILANHPKELEKVIQDVKEKKYEIKDNYIRKCILELFRLNNAVNSTFRALTEDFKFNDSTQVFPAGTQFVFFNNPVLRDLFEKPHQFIPERWDFELEESYRALMFNQANQKCPGKELVISLLTFSLISYLEINKFKVRTAQKINPNHIPYIINPCTIEFETDSDSESDSD